MLIAYPIYLIRIFLVWLANILKKGLRPPEYVTFTLHGSYPDLKTPPESILQRRMIARAKSLQELADDFRTVSKDPRVKGIILHLGKPELTLAQIQTLNSSIREIQSKNKEVIAWSTGYDSSTYCLAAACNRVLLQEGGIIYTLGFTNRQLYLKNALEHLGIELDVVQVSPYKSALERFVRSKMSEQVREMTEWLLDSYYSQFVKAIANGRNLGQDKVQELIGQTPLYGEKALDTGAVDGIINAEDLPSYLGEEKPARLAAWDECKKCFPRPLPPRPGRYIALLRVQGNIIDGKSRRSPSRPPVPAPFLFNDQTGDLSFVQQARMALKDKRVKAVLLYIDSGGGSAAASEAITAVLGKIAARKPLVAMMSSIAGSGGYYVATPAPYIIAQPATLTGSIGVIAAKIVNAQLLDKLLLNRETIRRGQKELFGSPEELFNEEERKKALDFIFHVYELFIKRVAESRALQAEAVKEVGGGKVWTGEQALSKGLVDELGGLETALAILHKEADLPENVPLVEIPLPRQETAPLPTAAAWAEHALINMANLKDGKALLAGPLYFCQHLEK